MLNEVSPSEMTEELTFQVEEQTSSDINVSPTQESNLEILKAELSFFASPLIKDFESDVHSTLKNIELTCAVDFTTLCDPSPMNTFSFKSQSRGSLNSVNFNSKFAIAVGKHTLIHDKPILAIEKEMLTKKSRHLRGENGPNHRQLVSLFGADSRSHNGIDMITAFSHGYEGDHHNHAGSVGSDGSHPGSGGLDGDHHDHNHPGSEGSDGDHHDHDHPGSGGPNGNHPGSEGPDGDHHDHDHPGSEGPDGDHHHHDHAGSGGPDGDHRDHDHSGSGGLDGGHPGSEGPDGDHSDYLEVNSPLRSRGNDGESAIPPGQLTLANGEEGSYLQDNESIESWSDLEDDGDRDDHSYDEDTDLDYSASLGYGDLGDMCMLSNYDKLSPHCRSAVNDLISLRQQYVDEESGHHRGAGKHCQFLIYALTFVGLVIFRRLVLKRKDKGEMRTALAINDANSGGKTQFKADSSIVTTTTTSVSAPLTMLSSIKNKFGGITAGFAAPSAADGAYSSLPSDISVHGSPTPMNIVTGVPVPAPITAEQQGTTNWI